MEERFDVAFAELTTTRVGGPARRLVEVGFADEAIEVVRRCDAAGESLLVLGAGSNIVVGDDGFPGTVLRATWRGRLVRRTAPDRVELSLAAGEDWDDVVALSVSEGWSGVEALSGVPGLAGATPIQNVGAYGQEVADVLSSVDVYDRSTGVRLSLDATDCGFGYRTSRFKREPGRFVVLGVTLELARSAASRPVAYPELAQALGGRVGASAPLGEVRDAVLSLRRAKGMVLDPSDHDTWSTGSFFTNPVLDPEQAATLPDDAPRWSQPDGSVKTSAAWLIERSGFGRGSGTDLTGGRASLSTKHPLAVTNRGGASARDVLVIARAVREAVEVRFGVTLVPEPTILA